MTEHALHTQPPRLLLPRLTVATLELLDALQHDKTIMNTSTASVKENVVTHRFVAADGADLRAAHDCCENAEEE